MFIGSLRVSVTDYVIIIIILAFLISIPTNPNVESTGFKPTWKLNVALTIKKREEGKNNVFIILFQIAFAPNKPLQIPHELYSVSHRIRVGQVSKRGESAIPY